MDFVVRNIPATGLDGAFRIHLAPEAIQQAGLTFNEPCHILDEHGKVIGCGIAWRAAEKMGASPKMKPARMSETLRDAFGIKEGSHVNLQPTKSGILHAETLTLTDVTPDELISGHEKEMGDDKWQWRAGFALVSAEAVANGMTFDVMAKKGVKKRFAVERVASDKMSTGVPHLCYVNDKTQVHFSDGAPSAPSTPGPATNGDYCMPLSTQGIGGLVEQLQTLNRAMEHVLQQTRAGPERSQRMNFPVLLHGYEGTGKTFLLDRLRRSNFRKVLHLDTTIVNSNIASKNETAITDIFKEARTNQPSLIVADDLQRLAPAGDNKVYMSTLCQELDNIHDTGIMVVGATRSLQDVHTDVLGPTRFVNKIELSIPDITAREQVLQALIPSSLSSSRAQIHLLSARTHGFTCRDLAELVNVARLCAMNRLPSTSHSHDAPSEPTATEDDETFDPSNADWTYALSKVRPAALREIFFETPNVKWSDIGGSSSVRAHLDEIIGWPLKYPDLMKKHKLPAQKGMLLYGPPGCSKTLTAQAVAANYEMNFIAVKGAELISMYVGESERSVREIFRKARTAKPCIVFFDEIDSIASERDAAGTKGLNVLTTLLNEMDGFESLDGVFVLAATNKPEVLDPAIMRPGRFDQHLYLPPPNEAARREILELQLDGASREDDLDTAKLVRLTESYTGAEIVSVCAEAKRHMLRRLLAGQGSTIRMDDFQNALAHVRPRTTREMLEGYESFARG